jgi:two-component system, cell cycle sensor histidine kinase and response regulator CckA
MKSVRKSPPKRKSKSGPGNIYFEAWKHSLDGMRIIDESGIILQVNDAYCRLVGKSQQELEGESFTSVYAERNYTTIIQKQRVFFRNRQNESRYEREYELWDGKKVWFHVHNVFLPSRGTSARLLSIFRDITEPKGTEKEIRESGERYRKLIELMPFAVAIHVEGKMAYLNPAGIMMCGETSMDKIIGRPVMDFVHPDYRAIVAKRIRAGIEKGELAMTMEEKFLRPDGSTMDVEATSIPFIFDGKPAMQVVFQDISRRKETERIMRLSQFSIERSRDSVLWLDRNRRIVYANEAASRSLEYSREELISLSMSDIEAESDKDSSKNFIHDLKARGSKTFQSQLRTKSGNVFPVEIDSNYINFEGEEGSFSFVRDITERKRAEEALRQSERNYREIFNAVNEAIFIQDGKTAKIIDMNERVLDMYEYTRQEVMNKSIADLSVDEAPYRMEHITEWIYRTKIEGPQVFEWKAVKRSGEKFWVEMAFRHSTIGDQDRVIAVVRDITDRKMAENALRESEYRLKRAQAMAHVGNWELDLSTQMMWASEEAFQIYGIERIHSEIPFEMFQGRVLLDDQPRLENTLQKLLLENRRYDEEFQICRADNGQIRYVHSRAEVIRDSTGNPLKVSGVTQDITEQKEAEELLRDREQELSESEHRYRALFETSPDAILLTDLKGRIIAGNYRVARMHGFKNFEEILRSSLNGFDLIDPTQTLQVDDYMARLLAEGVLREVEVVARRKDNTTFPMELSASVIPDEDGKPKALVAITRDLTERKRAEDALRQAQKMESIGLLAGGIAHDFNNLLHALLGHASIALMKLPPESQVRTHISKAINAGERATELTKQLLAYSGRGKFKITQVDLSRLIEENLHLFEIAIPKNIVLQMQLDEKIPSVEADAAQIQQVIMNLIINAAEAIGNSHGTIAVRSGSIDIDSTDSFWWKYTGESLRPGTYTFLEIRDTGCGMEPEIIERIFEPFFTTKFTGRGLGLAAVLGIIRGHKGGLHVESQVGTGTKFRIAIPTATGLIEQTSTLADTIAMVISEKAILAIDDEEMILDLVRDTLAYAGLKVLTANNGEEGIVIYNARRDDIAVVLLDLSMPVMGGEETLRRLLAINPDVRVILSSGYTEEEVAARFQGVRAADFIQKPYQPNVLLRKIRDVIGGKDNPAL